MDLPYLDVCVCYRGVGLCFYATILLIIRVYFYKLIRILLSLLKLKIMNTKLTLTIDKDVIEQAKRYAKSENRSLSNLIESFLRQVSKNENKTNKKELHPEILALKGSIKVPKDFDYKKELEEALKEKYLK